MTNISFEKAVEKKWSKIQLIALNGSSAYFGLYFQSEN